MKVNTLQGVTSHRETRLLKIEATGDFFHKKITPKIRLTGQWLEKAGFRANNRVQVVIEQPGTITLHFLEQERRGEL